MPTIKKEGETKGPLFGVVVIGIIVVAAYYLWTSLGGGYWAVYLKTGEIYFGKMSKFPTLTLSDPYLLQLTGDAENPFSISRFSNSVWAPEGKIYIEKDNVIWKSKISKDSGLMQLFNNPELLQQVAQQQAGSVVDTVGGEE